MMKNKQINNYALTAMRVILGALFTLPGLDKIMGLLGEGHMIANMLGVPVAWILAIVEVTFGVFLLIGFKPQIAAVPLSIVMIGAIVMTVIPSFAENPMAMITLMFHVLAITGLIVIATSGPGAFAVDKQ